MVISPLTGVFAALLLTAGAATMAFGLLRRATGLLRLGAALMITLSVSRFFFLH